MIYTTDLTSLLFVGKLYTYPMGHEPTASLSLILLWENEVLV